MAHLRRFGYPLGSPERTAHVEALVDLRELAGEEALVAYAETARALRGDYAMPLWGLPRRLLKLKR